MRSAFEVIHQMGNDVRGARLARELKILARQHVPIKSQAKFHSMIYAAH
jgi:hypothetical protein